jgi:hypothetical protein
MMMMMMMMINMMMSHTLVMTLSRTDRPCLASAHPTVIKLSHWRYQKKWQGAPPLPHRTVIRAKSPPPSRTPPSLKSPIESRAHALKGCAPFALWRQEDWLRTVKKVYTSPTVSRTTHFYIANNPSRKSEGSGAG